MKEEWKTEPDELSWQDGATGLYCYVRRGPAELGHLCGYVAVPNGHPWHGIGYADIDPAPDVHWGLTYSADHAPGQKPDGQWWLGFDCAHSGDLLPGSSFKGGLNETYRNIAFVCGECEKLGRAVGGAA